MYSTRVLRLAVLDRETKELRPTLWSYRLPMTSGPVAVKVRELDGHRPPDEAHRFRPLRLDPLLQILYMWTCSPSLTTTAGPVLRRHRHIHGQDREGEPATSRRGIVPSPARVGAGLEVAPAAAQQRPLLGLGWIRRPTAAENRPPAAPADRIDGGTKNAVLITGA